MLGGRGGDDKSSEKIILDTSGNFSHSLRTASQRFSWLAVMIANLSWLSRRKAGFCGDAVKSMTSGKVGAVDVSGILLLYLDRERI